MLSKYLIPTWSACGYSSIRDSLPFDDFWWYPCPNVADFGWFLMYPRPTSQFVSGWPMAETGDGRGSRLRGANPEWLHQHRLHLHGHSGSPSSVCPIMGPPSHHEMCNVSNGENENARLDSRGRALVPLFGTDMYRSISSSATFSNISHISPITCQDSAHVHARKLAAKARCAASPWGGQAQWSTSYKLMLSTKMLSYKLINPPVQLSLNS